MKTTLFCAIAVALLFSGCKSSHKTVSNTTSSSPARGELTYEKADTDEDPVFEIVDQMPQFPGGLDSMISFLRSNIVYPEVDKNSGVEGISYIQFVVRQTGEVTDTRVFPSLIKMATENMHAESIRIVRLMPNWTPGVQNGKIVSTRFVLPVKYTLRKKPASTK